MELLCRLCADNKHQIRNIFDEDGIRRKIGFRIQSILQISVSKDDLLPQNICLLCLGKLENFCAFVGDCHSVQIRLRDQIAKENHNSRISDDTKLDLQIHDGEDTSKSPPQMEQNRKMIILVPKLHLTSSASDQITSEINNEYSNYRNSLKDNDGKNQISTKRSSAQSVPECHLSNVTNDDIVENVSNFHSFQSDLKSETKLYELTDSYLDIPFDPLDTPVTEEHYKKDNSSTTDITDTNFFNSYTHNGSTYFIKNTTCNITDLGNFSLNNDNSVIHSSCNYPIPVSKTSNSNNICAQKERRSVSVTFDVEQFENFFENGKIDEAQLQKLGEEIFHKNARKIIEKDCLKLNYKGMHLQNMNDGFIEDHCLSKPCELKRTPLSSEIEIVTISDDDDANNSTRVEDCLIKENDKLRELKYELEVENSKSSDARLMSQSTDSSETKNVTDNNTSDDAEETRIVFNLDIKKDARELCSDDRNPSVTLEKSKKLTVLLHPLNDNFITKNTSDHCIEENVGSASSTTKFEKRTHPCNICGLNFTGKVALKKHSCKKHERKIFKCSLCYGFVTTQKYKLSQHMREKHVKTFICDICGKRLGKKCKLILHIRSEHTDTSPMKCSYCAVTFTRRFLLTEHLKEHLSKEQYICNICNSNFKSKRELKTHVTRKHTERKIKCTLCSYAAAHKYLLNQHNREVHDKRFVCDVCDKRLGKKSKLSVHIQTEHTNQLPMKCDYCHLSFSQKYQYRVHLREHSLNKRWLCSFCRCDFDQKFKLRIHISQFHDTKVVECKLCSFSTSHKYRLKQHVREVHEKRFICGVCGKRESKKSRLKVHIQNRHTKKKLYTCEFCDSEYRLKFRYDEHMKKHT